MCAGQALRSSMYAEWAEVTSTKEVNSIVERTGFDPWSAIEIAVNSGLKDEQG